MNAMVLAAGLGKRLRPLTDSVPKPMVEMGGRPLLEQTLLQLATLQPERVVINVHHLAEKITQPIGDGAACGVRVFWSRETELMDTGGGVRMALPLLGEHPFLAVNGDVAWQMDLTTLIQGFDPERMDGLLGLVPTPDGMTRGDFLPEQDGRLRRATRPGEGLLYSGLQMLHPKALLDYPVEPFSLNRFYDDAMAAGRLFGIPLAGFWADIGTPDRLTAARLAWKNRFAFGDGLAYKDLRISDC
ncbi:MAG: nucleotidyltransferase family protein [Magnetococcales bacterium]|nr:nucleotidyltransferase family protein [Magnetococcales bacterium]